MRSAPDFRLWSKLITKWSSEELLANNRNSGTMIFSHQVPSWCFKLNFNVDVSSKRCIWKNKFVILKTCKFYISTIIIAEMKRNFEKMLLLFLYLKLMIDLGKSDQHNRIILNGIQSSRSHTFQNYSNSIMI